MNTAELQTDVLQMILKIKNQNVLYAIRELITNLDEAIYQEDTVDFLDDMPDEVRLDYEESIKEAERGELTPTDEVMQRMKDKYNLAI